ncbi:MAG: protein translocase subunit SecF [Alphaproteobacteria bacterium]
MRLRLVPQDTHVGFIGLRRIAYVISAIAIIASIALFGARGLNYGIDFQGGTLIEVGTEGPADIARMRSTLNGLGLGDVQIQEFGAANDVLIRVEQQAGGDEVQQSVVDIVKDALNANFDGITYRRVEVVGPKVSSELIEAGALAVILAVVAVLIYIWLRFEWQFSVGAVVALVHDVVLTIGVFAGLGLEFNLSIIAAILTIVGYSLNDTVVVYDRVRENLRKYKKKPLHDLLDLSLNETLSRTVMTSVTTLLALSALYIFGGEVIRGFTFAMIWGVLVGTYSSIFVASPILLAIGVKRDWSKAAAEARP